MHENSRMSARPFSGRLTIRAVHGADSRHIYLDRYYQGEIVRTSKGWRPTLRYVDLGCWPNVDAAENAMRAWFAGPDVVPW